MLTFVSFVILLLVLIFVHELGHFLAAKLIGVKVERFSLGFPPKAWSKTIGETEYQLAWLPLGGYVKMYGEDPSGEEKVPPEMEHRSFSHQKPLAKMFIVLAGPAFNLIFAALLFWGLLWLDGIQHLSPTVGPVQSGSPAAEAGIQMNDTLVAINGQPVRFFDELNDVLQNKPGDPISLTIRRQGLEETHKLTPTPLETKNLFNEPQVVYGVGISHRMPPVISKVRPGKPAYEGGLRDGDLISAIDGRATPDWQDVLDAIQGPVEERGSTFPRAVKPLFFTVQRNGQELRLEITPEMTTGLNTSGETVYTPMVGLEARPMLVKENVGFFRAAVLGTQEAFNMIKLTLLSVQKLITGQVSAKTLGGPILIAEVTGDRAKAGLAPLLSLAAFISINLGILNLLPIPILDGGQFLFFLIEAIRRKPLSLRFREGAQWLGIAFLGLLMVTVFYNDIGRLITRWTTKTEVEQIHVSPTALPPSSSSVLGE